MIYGKKVTKFFILSSLLSNFSIFSMSTIKLHEPFIASKWKKDSSFQFSINGYASFDDRAYNDDGDKVNVLRVFDADQNALQMLNGFASSSDIGQLNVLINANDDGTRGHFLLDGNLDDYVLGFSGRLCLPESFSISLDMPFHHRKLHNVVWQEQTKSLTAADIRLKENLTNDFFAKVKTLSGGLDLEGWQRSGLGDITMLLNWNPDFQQPKPILKNIRLNLRSGLSFPTGKKKNEDKVLAFAFGNDGALGLLFGAGLDATLGSFACIGLDVELTHLFGNKKNRRIKTNEKQTELLLLQKAYSFKDYGLTQKFNLYAQWNIVKTLSLKIGYQFIRHGDDRLSLFSQDFSESIANSAISLEEWTMHNIFIVTSYSCNKLHNKINPSIKLFAQLPFNGKNSVQLSRLGIQLSINF